ncbi:MAG: DUF503 domain-containing protein [Deltaproteobacteria bacterium]|nr:DUF503 domain-containing protein [Deltaproteobacteria bacterium]
MVIGAMSIELFIHENNSLKGKRRIVKSIIGKVKSRFNLAIAEVEYNDKWQRIGLGISAVGNDRGHIDSVLATVLTFIESLYLAEIIDSRIEIINV